MHAQGEFANMRLPLVVDGAALDIAAIHRPGERPPILFLHGFGSTKEDYADIVRHPAFDGRPFVAYDAPGCGETACADLSRISIPFLVKTAEAVLDHFGWRTFHLVGHSMGGLTALMLASRWPDRVLSFTDIEGNIAPEDCFLSRQIVGDPEADAERFFDAFIERTRHAPAYASALYAASLRHKVRAGAVRGIFESMVDLSDNGGLMDRFLGLPCPRLFMYGEQNASLSYLRHIQAHGVRWRRSRPAALPHVLQPGPDVGADRPVPGACRRRVAPSAPATPRAAGSGFGAISRSLSAGQFGDFDEIEVRVADVDGADPLRGAGACHGALHDGPVGLRQPFDHRVERDRGDEAQIQRARHRQVRLGLELLPAHVQIDLLVAEAKGDAPLAEAFELHAQHARVEIDGGVGLRGGQHQVVEVVDHEKGFEERIGARP